MTFGLNGPTPHKGIQEAQNMKNNGGGGNLGYFQRGKKKKNDDDEIDMFTSSAEADEFGYEDLEEPKDSGLLDKVAEKFKKIFGG